MQPWHRTTVGGQTDAELYEQHAPELVRFATAIAGPTDAADIVSAAFVHVLGSPSWPHVTNRRAYLFRAVLNEARAQHRSDSRRRVREQRASVHERVDDTTDAEVLGPLTALSVRQRAVVVLTYWQDMDQQAIAETLGITRGSVARHLDRAHARLRELMAYD